MTSGKHVIPDALRHEVLRRRSGTGLASGVTCLLP